MLSPRARTLNSLWLFFILVFCWTWFFWLLAAALGTSVQTASGKSLLLLGLLGPMLGGIGFTYLAQDKEYQRQYWSRIVDSRRIGAKWCAIIFLFVPVLMAIAVLLDVASSGNETLARIGRRVNAVSIDALGDRSICARSIHEGSPFPPFRTPPPLPFYPPPPFFEELGWRAYALDQLQARWNALVSSVILGTLWALWHLPLFFFKDTLHYVQGVWSPWFWLFMAGIVPTAVIYTWIFNNTQRSTLAAIFFHFMSNVTYELANVTDGTNLYATLLWIVAAVVVVALWGAPTLTRRSTRITQGGTVFLKPRFELVALGPCPKSRHSIASQRNDAMCQSRTCSISSDRIARAREQRRRPLCQVASQSG